MVTPAANSPAPQGASVMDESTPGAGSSDQAQTVEVPASAIGGAKEGDTVQFKVVSVDASNGVANLAPVQPGANPDGGSDSLGDDFEADKMKGAS